MKFIFQLRFAYYIVVLCSIIGAGVMMFAGVVKTFKAVLLLFDASIYTASGNLGNLTTKYMIQSIDLFLFSMILVIFGSAVHSLFISSEENTIIAKLPGFTRVKSVAQLKYILAEVIIVILFVQFLKLVISESKLHWEMLIIPASILGMSLALKFLKSSHED